jgi:hypothetical protein
MKIVGTGLAASAGSPRAATGVVHRKRVSFRARMLNANPLVSFILDRQFNSRVHLTRRADNDRTDANRDRG